jgi:hypothetical protein
MPRTMMKKIDTTVITRDTPYAMNRHHHGNIHADPFLAFELN